MLDRPNKKYIGRCIYCDSTEDLTDEHVAPEGLQGNFILEKASCKEHARATSYIEGVALRGMFQAVRSHFGFVGRRHKKRAKKRGPPSLGVSFENPDGSVERVPLILPAHPYRLVMPLLDAPGIIVGRPRCQAFPVGSIRARIHTDSASLWKMQGLQANDPQGRQLIEKFDIGNFTKFMAKIGYCFAVFLLSEPFEPLIVELILTPPPDALLGPYFVGRAFQQRGAQQFPVPTDRIHGVFVRAEWVGGTCYVIARLWIFQDRGTPIYDVVVGRMIDSNSVKTASADDA